MADLFSCGICQHSESDLIPFLKHKLQHHGPRMGYVCQVCHISYTKEDSLTRHYKQKHGISFTSRKRKAKDVPELQSGDNSASLDGKTGNNSDDNDCNVDVIKLFTNDNTGNSSQNTSDMIETQKSPRSNVPESNEFLNKIISKEDETSGNKEVVTVLESIQPNHDIGINNVQLKRNDLTLNDGPAVIVKENDFVQEEGEVNCINESMVNNTNNQNEVLLSHVMDETNMVTCNIEIISLDPSNELCIDDKGDDNDVEDDSEDEIQQEEKLTECDFFFCIKSDINTGKTLVYERQDLCCIYCNYQDMVLANLYQHMFDHHPSHLNTDQDIKLQTDVENIKLIKFSEYKEQCHKFKMENSKRIRNTEMQDQAGEFHCPKCDKIFTRLRYLRKHLPLHKSDKPFLCDYCGKSFKTRTYLSIHHKSHTSKKMFKCEQCDFTSLSSAQIRLHRQQHNRGCVLCDICGNAYSDKSTLTKHKRVHDPNRPYQCDYPGCTWRFMTEVMCRAHRRNHDTEGKFKCQHCGYAFRHRHHVRRHEARVHGIPQPSSNKTETTPDSYIEVTPITIAQEAGQGSPVNVVVESTIPCLHDTAGGQLVIMTDSEGNAINYHLTEISNQTDLEGRQTINIIPQITYGNIIVGEAENDNSIIKVSDLKNHL